MTRKKNNNMQYPQIEKRKTNRGDRFFVKGEPAFSGSQLHGFKTEDSLMRCYTWWFHNIYLKKQKGKEAKTEWENGGRDEFYKKDTTVKEKKDFGCKPKQMSSLPVPKIESIIAEYDAKDIPSWLD